MMVVVEKGAGGDGGGGGGVVDDMGEGMLRCNDHPYRNNPGGICAFCLQEKLGKLISSSKSVPSFPSSSSSSPDFRSEGGGGVGVGVGGLAGSSSISFLVPHSSTFTNPTINNSHSNGGYSGSHHSRRARMVPFVSHQNDKAKKVLMGSSDASLVLERSKSTSVRRRQFFDANEYSPRKKKFWSFLSLTTRKRSNRDGRDGESTTTTQSATSAVTVAATSGKDKGVESSSSTMRGDYVDDDESPNSSHTSSSSFGRKVARSRSVGCGSRSFSGDFLERISTGFGDCTLRRVESQREAKPKSVLHHHRGAPAGDEAQRIKERVKCGGIFGGFSSSYWQQSSSAAAAVVVAAAPPHSRSKSRGWTFASPMRAFTKPPSSSSSKPNDKDSSRRDVQVTPSKESTAAGSGGGMNTTTTSETNPNLSAIPSLLTVRV